MMKTAEIWPCMLLWMAVAWPMLPCKAKRQYLFNLQVSTYCLLALQKNLAVTGSSLVLFLKRKLLNAAVFALNCLKVPSLTGTVNFL